jgi:hypothetical protein
MAIKLNERTLALLAARSSSESLAYILTFEPTVPVRIYAKDLNRRRQMLFIQIYPASPSGL